MSGFYDTIGYQQARTLERLSRLSLELREARDGVLRHYGIAHEDELRARVLAGEAPEHPAYEHVLALRILDDTRERVRAMLAAGGRDDGVPVSLNFALRDAVASRHAALLAAPPALTLDALSLSLANGVQLEVHWASPDEYALRWRGADGREARLDTAPLHGATAHLHHAGGRVQADTLTRPGVAPEDNLSAVIVALAANGRLGLED